ncbi:PLP-dependent transferase [Mycena olivaceomarginata]|nr:PLP-dependent transferase [Mycena olivaceomarginata]
MSRGPLLSSRARKRQALAPPHNYTPPAEPYYDPDLYPDGVINVSTAENSLLTDRLIEACFYVFSQNIQIHSSMQSTAFLAPTNDLSATSQVPVHADQIDVAHGRGSVAAVRQRPFNPLVQVTRPRTGENSVAGPGIGALLAQLIWAIADEGAGVLLSAVPANELPIAILWFAVLSPYKLVYLHDPQMNPAEVDSLSLDVIPYLEKKLLESAQSSVEIQVLVLCNPHNPIPQIIARDVVQAYALFAEKHNLHLVVDEVYALSTFDSAYPPAVNAKFESILSYDLAGLGVDPSRVHVLAGPTKDFGASGIKLGLLVSPSNLPLVALLRPLFNATPISAASDLLFARVLSDKPFVETFLADNRKALGAAYELVARWMIFHNLPFTRANAGPYVIVDFAPFIARFADPSSGDIEKLDLAVAAMLAQKVFLKPTTLMADPIPTRFRLIFTHRRSTMEVSLLTVWMQLALRRIERAFGVAEAPLSD